MKTGIIKLTLKDLGKCLKPCSKAYYSIHINCGGPGVTIGDKVYEADNDLSGAARFLPTNDYWGISNTGSLWNTEDTINEYLATNVSILTMNDSQLYATARRSPLSVTYYGRCLANGNYTVTLHFAEIVFRDSRSYKGLGRRAFDVYIQGVNIFKNFDIKNEGGGVDKPIIRTLNNVHVTNGTLEIRFQYAGKGTTAVPVRGLYGPLISAISMQSEFKPPTHGKNRTLQILGAVAATVFLALTVFGIAWKKGYIGSQILKERDLRGLDMKTGVFTYKQIKAATNNFAESNKLGEGGFGSVYKGALQDGTLIAVKQLSSKSKQGNREFVNEIGMIAGIQHINVVRLHGWCAEHNHLLLVYEYMKNNSLAHALFDKSTTEIDWPTRQRICVGIARGLAFLHEETALKMVHRDIKASNILLDTDLTPKISDFGLAKLNDKEKTHISTKVAGTLGYMAPEYALWGYLTYKADVYSFGVLALEIVAGKNNMKCQPSEDYVSLLDLVFVLKEKGSLMELVDPRLGSNFNKMEAVRMFEVAILCINQSPALRPTMSEVVNMLEGCTMESDMNLATSEDDFRLQTVIGKVEDMQTPQDIVIQQPSFSVYDLDPGSQTSEESRILRHENLVVLDETNIFTNSQTKHICVGIARGLAFLHEETALTMVHRDIKASNILLDTNLTPKISDFGLAKLNEKENTHIALELLELWYMAPEYALWGYLTYKADVYSFGVLALEIVAGKNNMKYRPKEDYVSLLDLAVVLKEKVTLLDLVDSRLASDYNKIEAERMMRIALLCTNQSPALRPTMSEVVNMLEGRTKIKESGMNPTAEDELRMQAVRQKVEDMQPPAPHDPVIQQSSYSIHDLYPNSQISKESRILDE
ncbi:hypothetical protein M8C21_030816 [Ambrosia artemisiifolia]|uniref:non-specific serine/threonine protein kinase n=1 Tax=Ambrosia artemisiifolia TaxID=4212 RepID=A0AAD5G8D0_AMBAR|nr:hypothetical protein M8C21_030816 [Ambrosia artemisiifolia]